MSKPEKIKPERFFFQLNDKPQKVVEMKNLGDYLRAWPADRRCRIVVTEGKEKRSEEQNALWWAWSNELARAHDDSEDKDYYHAHNKLYVLLPLMLHDAKFERWREEAMIINAAIRAQTSEALQLWTAYKVIESSSLSPDEGAVYTEKLMRYWDERGVKLEVKASTKRYQHYPEVA